MRNIKSLRKREKVSMRERERENESVIEKERERKKTKKVFFATFDWKEIVAFQKL